MRGSLILIHCAELYEHLPVLYSGLSSSTRKAHNMFVPSVRPSVLYQRLYDFWTHFLCVLFGFKKVRGVNEQQKVSSAHLLRPCYDQSLLLSSGSVVIIRLCCYHQALLLSSGSVVIISLCCYHQSLLLSSGSVVIISLCCYHQSLLLSSGSVILCTHRTHVL